MCIGYHSLCGTSRLPSSAKQWLIYAGAHDRYRSLRTTCIMCMWQNAAVSQCLGSRSASKKMRRDAIFC
jgi:hypothetical protein